MQASGMHANFKLQTGKEHIQQIIDNISIALLIFEITYDTADHLCKCLTVINKYKVKANSIPASLFERKNNQG